MDITRFKDTKTGLTVPISTPTGPDHAFIPNKLPPNWEFPVRLWPKLVTAQRALSKLDGIGRTLPHPELLISPLKTREAIASSRIEGTYATAQELMLFEIAPKSGGDQGNASLEVSNYKSSLATGTKLLQELPFCGRLIKQLHGILMEDVRGQHSRRGEWRDYQVAIGSDRRYVPPPANEIERCISDLEHYTNDEGQSYDPLVKAFLIHYQFEAIHPFGDGNGRIGRVLLSLMIGKMCDLQYPWLYMSPYFERYKDEYVDNLLRISTEGAWEKWIDYCLTGTILQANDAITRCEALGTLKREMLERVRPECTTRTERIIDDLFSRPLVRVAELHKDLNVTYPTAQADVDVLVKCQILKHLEGIKPKAYFSPEIFAIAFAEQFGMEPQLKSTIDNPNTQSDKTVSV